MSVSSNLTEQPTRSVVTSPAGSAGEIEAGTTVGRYIVQESIGAGGMGEVYAAHDPGLDRRVALKLVHSGTFEEAGTEQRRLLREAQALARLSHPNVVEVYDAGTHAGRVYIAMQFVEGVTLSDWAKAAEYDWREIVSVLLEAGRGLAAAHEHGIVHRDFKPGNVMVSPSGRVRVLDFGLARDSSEVSVGSVPVRVGERNADTSSSGRGGTLSVALTRTGELLGTPGYMASEQFSGLTTDARTDQFAFCVVAYKLLFRRAPFEGATPRELQRNVVDGRLRRPPSSTGVPAWVWGVLERGLERSPQRRWPSMQVVLQRLEHAERGRRWWWALGVGVTAVGGMGALAWTGPQEVACRETEADLQGIWDVATKTRTEAAFMSTDAPFAIDAWRAIEEAVDLHTEDYLHQRQAACDATHVHNEQAPEVLDLRIACLEDRKRELAAMIEVFRDPDTKLVEGAPHAVLRLRSPGECSDVERLGASIEPPPPERRAAIDALEAELDHAEALFLAGRWTVPLEPIRELSARASSLAYDPVISRARSIEASFLDRQGQASESLAGYEAAAAAAARAGDRRQEAKALLGVTLVLGTRQRRSDESQRAARRAEALLDAIGRPPELVAQLRLVQGTALLAAEETEAAERRFEETIEAAGSSPRSEHLRVGALSNLAAVLVARGEYRRAMAKLTDAVEITRRRLGPQHPLLMHHQLNLGVIYIHLERYDDARRALAWTRAAEKVDGSVAKGLHNLGIALFHLGREEEALEAYREAYDTKRRLFGDDVDTVAATANNIGHVLLAQGNPREALSWFNRSLAALETSSGADSPRKIDVLLSLGAAHLSLESTGVGLKYAEEALRLTQVNDVSPEDRGQSRFLVARLRFAANADDRSARVLAEEALLDYARADAPIDSDVAEIRTWLAESAGSD